MLAVDTNVIVRFLTDDEPIQAKSARRLITSSPILLLDTVLLETEWVLRSLYGYPRDRIRSALCAFVAVDTVHLQPQSAAVEALEAYGAGMDFADALHLAGALRAGCEAFATFDRKLSTAARKSGAGAVKTL
jgi:predicted nucleic-acid-binding protein